MFEFWKRIFWEALGHSFEWIGKEPSEFVFALVIFVVIGFLLVLRKGLPTGWEEMKKRLPRVLGEDFAIAVCVFFLFFLFHMARDSYGEWKHADDQGRQTKQEFDNYRLKVEKTKPDLQPKIDTVLVGPAGDRENAVIGVIGKIENLGIPGTVEDWWLDLKFDDGRMIHGEIAAGPENKKPVYFGKNVQGQRAYLQGSEYWTNKRAEIIPTYGHLDGFLMALVRNVTKQEILEKNAAIVLTCSDITGAKHSFERHVRTGGTSAFDTLGIEGLQKPVPKH